jgi:hypothetical protein
MKMKQKMKDLLNEFWAPRELGENGGVDVSIKCKKLIEFLLSFGVEKLPMGPMICVSGYSCLLLA